MIGAVLSLKLPGTAREQHVNQGNPTPKRREVVVARPPFAGLKVVLEVGVAGGDLVHAPQRSRCERRPPEVRVEHDPGRVQHAPQRGGRLRTGDRKGALGEVTRVVPGHDLLARARECLACRADRRAVRQRGELTAADDLVDRRKLPEMHA